MNIEKNINGLRYKLSNENLKVGDHVWPIVDGRLTENDFYLHNLNWNAFELEDPHIILNLNYSSGAYEIQTNKGFGHKHKYFKIIEVEKQVARSIGKLITYDWEKI
jgi:hypothetical protein